MTQSKRLPQGLNYLGFLSKQLGDLRGITTLAHELIQNADDAKNDSGELSATRITFDFKDDALVVSNDAAFREIDFERIQDVAGGSKRDEAGARTTGAFGVGFISVYQVTDSPEIQSAGRRWILRPYEEEGSRIEEFEELSITHHKGTVFRLPWAFEESRVRRELKVSPVSRDNIDSFAEEIRSALPRAILFLKKLNTIELRRNGEPVRCVTKVVGDSSIAVEYDGVSRNWRIIEGEFAKEVLELKAKFSTYMDRNREERVRIAIRDTLLDDGVLFATLPTEQSTGLPFHVDADFFPASDRKSIAFEDSHDHRSEWNRTAIRAAASMLRDNLIPLRDMFSQDASTFWAMLGHLRRVYDGHRNETRIPLGAFWEELLPMLRKSPIVYTESGQWLAPAKVRITTGDEEKEAVPAFGDLGIDTVHQDLGSYRNLLTSTTNGTGVRTLSVEDIHEAFVRKRMINRRVDASPLQDSLLKLQWRGIYAVLENTSGSSKKRAAEELLGECALAPAVDGRLWPCRFLYKADKGICDIFVSLVLDGVSFLAERGVPLLERLCRQFEPRNGIAELERLHSEGYNFQENWRDGRFDPVAALGWFDANKVKLTEDEELRSRLMEIPLFPSTGNLHPLSVLWLPGGFDDPLGDADIVDMKRLRGFSDFLRFLGAKELTFSDYAERYGPKAFAPSSTVDLEAKRKLLDIFTTRIGEIKEISGLRTKLARTNIVECTDGEFRQPNEAYIPCEEVREVFGTSVHYARLAEKTESRTDLYRWLGVESSPRPHHVMLFLDKLTITAPNRSSTQTIKRLLEIIGKSFPHLSNDVKQRYGFLQTKAWLPSEGDSDRWYRPDQLHAIYNKSLFESQAQFLNAPSGVQQEIRDFVAYLGVKLSPQPFQVVKHLLECSERDEMPPKGIYDWLNNVAESNHLRKLLKSKCLRVEGKYLRPDQVFWGQHSLGRFRVQLGEEFRSYQKLLSVLGIRESPDHKDAVQVLKEVGADIGHSHLEADDRRVVHQCWIMLSEALKEGEVEGESIRSALNAVNCVPNTQELLQPPSWMFFEDRPGLADKFKLLSTNSIGRHERVWPAMRAAGVRLVSDVVQGTIHEALNRQEDEKLKGQVMERVDLIRAISNDAVQLDDIRFIRADQLKVTWHLEAFDRTEATQPEPSSAHLEKSARVIYFALQDDNLPWSAIARELTQAIAPEEEVSSISPGLRIILEAGSHGGALAELSELGIAQTQELGELENRGSVAISFEEVPGPEGCDEVPPGDEATSDGTADEGSQVEVGGSEGSDSMLTDGAVGPPARSSDGLPGVVARPSRPADTGSSDSGIGSGEASHQTLGPSPEELDEPEPFAKVFFGVQALAPLEAPDRRVTLSIGGDITDESNRRDSRQSREFGRTGGRVPKTVMQWQPTDAADDLADKFRRMVHADYDKRCQVCGGMFVMPNGEPQVFVVHLVRPSTDERTNHLGNLLGLCGWHYAVMRYGQKALLDPETGEPGEDEDWERMRDFVLEASEKIDDDGMTYIGLPVRFWNVYQEWKPEPVTINEEIRYSIPHWKYLCNLLKA